MITSASDATFDAEVLGSQLPVVVDFRAEWCLPCRLVEPVLAELAVEMSGRIRFVEVDCDLNPEVVARYGVVTLPTLQLWRDRELEGVIFGARPKGALRAEIMAALG